MGEAQEKLKADIEKINDELMIEKIRIFILGILAQQNIEERKGANEYFKKGKRNEREHRICD